MNNSRKFDVKLNVVSEKIRFYREKNNLSYQKLSDKLMLLGVDINKLPNEGSLKLNFLL